jgi:hypothetical protein
MEGLSERNIRSSWKTAGSMPWNPQKVLGSSQIVSRPQQPQKLKRKRASSTPELLKTPKKLYEAARALDGMDRLSRSSRTMFRKAGKAIARLSVGLARDFGLSFRI